MYAFGSISVLTYLNERARQHYRTKGSKNSRHTLKVEGVIEDDGGGKTPLEGN